MKKTLVTNLILLALVVGLALVAWFDPFTKPPPQPELLTHADASVIQTIKLSKAGQLQFSLEKRTTDHGSYWYLTSPVEMPANVEKVKQILNLLSTNSFRQYQIKSANLAKLGLDPPGWEFALDQILIKFGKTEPIDQRRYVLLDATVHLIDDRFSQYSFGSPLMLANLDILPVDKSVAEIHLPDKIIKRVDGQWHSSSAGDGHTQSTLNKYIDEWRYAQAQRVALADKPDIATNATPVTIYLEKVEQPIHLTVESTDRDFVITNKDWGVRYYVNNSIGEKLLHVPPPALE
ncbi:MAG: DUF4340 domain-containing protein [Gammaproteobacteria bacterium]|jgi:hypothetical protein